ncbi:hypothetical protein MNBD_PLANCTO02-1050 [hydrothermal vent metagenome]|uniref:Uncharacterized protein n=1 Tax=hydrothermal vent metagenome TaxID=652676 RepID=A0A3B1DUL0_9ZZZZ
MRNFILSGLLLFGAVVQVGCILPAWSAERNVRARQLIFWSENFRHIPKIWERVWFMDMPDVATPYRTWGGVI